MGHRSILTTVAVLVAVCSGAGAADGRVAAHDPPRLVPWSLLGNIGLGMSRARIEYSYGRPVAGAGSVAHYLGGGNSRIIVLYGSSGVEAIDTKSSYYRTKDGFGVGSHIPLGMCHPSTHGCTFRWRDLTYKTVTNVTGGEHQEGEWGRRWRDGLWTRVVQLFVTKGTVTEIYFARFR
jgi:hypothetical protein